VDKGRDWTERALLLDPDLGDIWAMYYSHELLHDPTRAAEVLKRAVTQVTILPHPLQQVPFPIGWPQAGLMGPDRTQNMRAWWWTKRSHRFRLASFHPP